MSRKRAKITPRVSSLLLTVSALSISLPTLGCDIRAGSEHSEKEHAGRQESSAEAQEVRGGLEAEKVETALSALGQADSGAALYRNEAGARTQDERNSIDIFSRVAPATVFVTQKQLVRDRWSRRALEVPAGSGSGFIWDKQGHIVTNFHVVAEGRSFEVELYDGNSYPAKFIGGDRQKDIAVLKIDAPASHLKPIHLPPKGYRPVVGQKTLAIGNPFGLDHTLTVGVISALGREVKGFGQVTIRGMIQTDASINPGNSGGPLLDSAGQLLGMNTIIFSKSGSSAGIGFAVPVDTIARVVPQVIRYGKPKRAGMGIDVVSDEIARANGIEGVVIRKVLPRTPAARAGLRGLRRTRGGIMLGDVIVGLGGKKVHNYDDLYNALDQHEIGKLVRVELLRDGKPVQMEIQLIELK